MSFRRKILQPYSFVISFPQQQMQQPSKSINGIPQTIKLNRKRDDHTGEPFKMSEGNKEQHSMATEHEFSLNVENVNWKNDTQVSLG